MTIQWFVGIDWGSQEHHVCIVDRELETRARFAVEHTPKGMARMLGEAARLGPLEDCVFALERPDGLVVETLLDHGGRVWSINPKQSDKFRERQTAAGAKDDRRDAWVLARAARTDGHVFREVRPPPGVVVRLRAASRQHTMASDEVIRYVARARDAIAAYYPAFAEVCDRFERDWVRDLWRLAPTPADAAKLRVEDVKALLRKARMGARRTAEGIIETLGSAALTACPATVEAEASRMAFIIDMLEVAVRHERRLEREMDTILDELVTHQAPVEGAAAPPSSPPQPDWASIATAVRSMPGAASKIPAGLMGEASEPLQRAAYREVRALAGAAPVTDQTGKRKGQNAPVRMRRARNDRLANLMQAWAQSATQADAYWRTYRAGLMARGHTQARANRQTADRLLAILCALIRDRTVYDRGRFPAPAEAP